MGTRGSPAFRSPSLPPSGSSCAYWLARAVVGRAWGVACTLLVLAVPGFLVNTSTFMTDLPAFSAEMACLALGVAALGRRAGAAGL